MIKEKDIRPIPKKILKLIKEQDNKDFPNGDSKRRFYAYLAKFGGELVKVTVAVKNRNNKAKDWVYKQVAVHCVNSDVCLIKDMVCYYIGGYVVGWFEQGLQKYPKWFEDERWWTDSVKIDPKAPILNAEYALTFPQYKYSQADKYAYVDLLDYLRIYEKFPQAEYLVKMGLSYLATSKVILKKVGRDKNFRKWLIQNKDELAKKRHFIYIVTRSYAEKKSLHYAQSYEELKKKYKNHDTAHEIVRLFGGDAKRFFDYLIRQDTNLATYADYYKACVYLQLDMTDTKNLTPIDFKRWHDMRIDEYNTAKAFKDAEERKELYAKFAAVAEKYLPLQRNTDTAFVVVIARSPQDLIREGEALSHCVGRMNYDQRFIREESLIFFVRDKQTPDVPFVTVEYSLSKKKVLQCYGEHDHAPNDSVLEFVNKKWLPFANRQLTKIQAAA
ncbi:MAG: PcfJ domain-containing protein [Roseburia sp.]|nr:PcfJ domain-containing protein [Roseburia sp.]